jgi:hypothetical protein
VKIQEYLVSAVQNIQVLLRYGSYLKKSPPVMMERIKGAMTRDMRSLFGLYGADELKNRPKGAIWLSLLSAIVH